MDENQTTPTIIHIEKTVFTFRRMKLYSCFKLYIYNELNSLKTLAKQETIKLPEQKHAGKYSVPLLVHIHYTQYWITYGMFI